MSWRGALLLATWCLLLAGCQRVRVPEAGAACTHLQAVRQVRGAPLCEDAWSCVRPPGTEIDRVGVHRLAPCEATDGPVVLYLPGMHMNGELPFVDPRHDVRVYLAQAGIRTWSVDYRTHAVRPDASETTLRALKAWDVARFADDVAWAAGFLRGADRGPLVLMGFSFGGTLAYRVASRSDVRPAGLVILDAAAEPGRAEEGGPAIDVGSTRLPWDARGRLLDLVVRKPGAPSPIEGYPDAATALAEILYTAKSFGGEGGLSAAREGVSDIEVIARLLRSYDRWWPRATLRAAAPDPPSTPLPVLAFSSTRMGQPWQESVAAAARRWGGPGARVRLLPGFGHLDVLVAQAAPFSVFEPIRRWLDAGLASD